MTGHVVLIGSESTTVDGSNPAPVDRLFTVFLYIPGGFLAEFLNHQH